MTKFEGCTSDVLFCDYIWSYKTSIDNDRIIADIDSLKEENPEGQAVSNYGGWQSPLFCTYDNVPQTALKALEREVGAFVNTICRDQGVDIYVHEMTWWANINGNLDYNTIHHHTNSTDFIAVYYAKYPADSGLLNMVRTDAGAYVGLNMGKPNGVKFKVDGEVGRVYVFPGHLHHYVEPHRSDELRYSVALNCTCKPTRYHRYLPQCDSRRTGTLSES